MSANLTVRKMEAMAHTEGLMEGNRIQLGVWSRVTLISCFWVFVAFGMSSFQSNVAMS